jgi:hypothetical protein
MKQDNQFVARTRLEEAVLHIAETDVDLIALLSDEANAVLVNFEVSKRLLADEVWPDNQVVECLLASGFEKYQLFELFLALGRFDLGLSFLRLHLLEAFFDLPASDT